MGRRDLLICGWTGMDADSARGKGRSQGRRKPGPAWGRSNSVTRSTSHPVSSLLSGVALEVSRPFKFSAKLVLMLGTLQSGGVSGIDGEHMMSVVSGSSIHPSIVPVNSTICNSESLPPNSLGTNVNRPTYIMVINNLFKNEIRLITSASSSRSPTGRTNVSNSQQFLCHPQPPRHQIQV